MVVWTCTTLSSARRICSAWTARSRTASELVPGGGATVAWTVFSPPALMNVVGSFVTRAPVTTNRTTATATTPSLVVRLRSAALIAGVYARIQIEFVGSPSASTLTDTLFTSRYARTGTTVRAHRSDARSAKVTVRANGRNSCETMPPTKPSGRNTPTVVTVAAGVAPAAPLRAFVDALRGRPPQAP